MTTLLLMGPPGCGKGTYGSILVREFSGTKVTMGDLVRHKLSDLSYSGRLIDDNLVNSIFAEEYKRLSGVAKLVLDGYPRSIEQSLFLKGLTEEKNLVVFFFEVDYNLLSKRILGRICCQNCGAVFNEYFNLPPNNCSSCGGDAFFKRKDDTEEVFSTRMNEYQTHTVPVIKYYESIGLVHRIDANGDLFDVSNKVRTLAKKYFS